MEGEHAQMWQIPCKMTNSSSKPLQTLGKWYQPRNPKKIPKPAQKKILQLFHTHLRFTHSHEYIYDTKMYAVIFAVTQQITMEYAGKTPFLKQGQWKCPWNLPTLVINQYFKHRAVTALTRGRIPLHMQENVQNLCL